MRGCGNRYKGSFVPPDHKEKDGRVSVFEFQDAIVPGWVGNAEPVRSN
jgi:hypothetical protein